MCSMILIFQIHPHTLPSKNLMTLLTRDFYWTQPLFHLNISSLTYNFDQLHTLLAGLDIKLNVIGITETRLKLNSMHTRTFELEGYIIEHTPTEWSCGGALLYTDHHINYKVRNDLKMYKAKELESIFIEILSQNSKSTIIGCIYWHPCIDPAQFNDVYLHDVLEKLSNESKTVVLMGDFNIDLLKYDSNIDSSTFLDKMYSSFVSITTNYSISNADWQYYL